MTILDNIDYEKDNFLNKKAKGISGGLVWLVTEIIQIVVCVIGAIFLLWAYAPFSSFVKAGITILSLIVVYDVFKNFVWVRWVLFKEGLE